MESVSNQEHLKDVQPGWRHYLSHEPRGQRARAAEARLGALGARRLLGLLTELALLRDGRQVRRCAAVAARLLLRHRAGSHAGDAGHCRRHGSRRACQGARVMLAAKEALLGRAGSVGGCCSRLLLCLSWRCRCAAVVLRMLGLQRKLQV